MRILKPDILEQLNLQENEKFFIELWYSMTHLPFSRFLSSQVHEFSNDNP